MKVYTCEIKDGYAKINNQVFYSSKNINPNFFLKELYFHLELDYPKFHKMDNLCKLGILGVEILIKNHKSLQIPGINVGIVLQNTSSSLDSDLIHYNRINDNKVSPSVFVYTLPNIIIGEVCIKNKWLNEGIFFIDSDLDNELLFQYSNILFDKTKTKTNIIGWIDVLKDAYELKLCSIDIESKNIDFNNLWS